MTYEDAGLPHTPGSSSGPTYEATGVIPGANQPQPLPIGPIYPTDAPRFVTAQHPYTGDFIKALNKDGLDGLLALPMQRLTRDDPTNDFGATYHPQAVALPLPAYRVDFEPDGAYARYNWELFFHAPMLIADRLTQDGRYDEARRWMQYVFDPTTNDAESAPARFWRLLPFRTNTALERAQDLLALLVYTGSDPAILARRGAVLAQVAEWVTHPFEPHRIARLRLVAYQKYVVMSYLDCLLAEADSLFRKDTIESNNEAAQLYVLALVILGRRPERVPAPGKAVARSYEDLVKLGLGAFSNPFVELENVVAPYGLDGAGPGAAAAMSIVPSTETLFFCTPDNEKLSGYWDTLEDRLYKLRHCLNIEGEVQQLPLFEPPIDPAALVRAVAAGLALGSAAAEVFAPPSRFRFTYLVTKALELAAELRSLAALLLSALEKGDAEAMANLRATHEVALLKAVRDVREQQVKEAQHTRDAITKTQETTTRRRDFYRNFTPRNEQESDHMERLKAAQERQELANLAEVAVAAAAQIPNVTVGTSGSPGGPHLTTTFGGSNAVAGLQSASRILSWMAGHQSYKANLASLQGGWARRADDVKLQEDLATKELEQIDKQLAAAGARTTIAETELTNHDQQIDQATEAADFLKDKFTNTELYQWMATEVSAVYHQTYKVAFDLAKRAERAYRFEHGLSSSSIVSYGWEGTRKGLLAAERLTLDLKRLEAAWMAAMPPPYEITKHVSLVLHDPAALMDLKLKGFCHVELPETLYDADHPGHYMRRLRSLRVTIPCVTGPYTSINCKVTLESSQERISTADPDNYPEQPVKDDPRFRYDFAARQSIVTSHGRSDPGRFALGADPSVYLPFEGAGAICRLRLDLPAESNGFDVDTISDVVLAIEYTARDGGDRLRQKAAQALTDLAKLPSDQDGLTPPLQRLFSARHEFGQEWHAFLRPASGTDQVLNLPLVLEHFPYLVRHKTLTVRRIDLYLFPRPGVSILPDGLTVAVGLPEPRTVPVKLAPPASEDIPAIGSASQVSEGNPPVTTPLESQPAIGGWTITVPGAATPTLAPGTVEDLLVLVTYTAG